MLKSTLWPNATKCEAATRRANGEAAVVEPRWHMKSKSFLSFLLLAFSLTFVSSAFAQSPSVEWTAWNAQITAHSGSVPLDIAETQIIKVTGGTLHGGSRNFSQPVNVQSVYLATNGGQPTQLTQGTSPGNYSVSNSNGDVVVDYELPQAANAGDSFAVQINYTVNPVTAGLIDWNVVPGTHPGQVKSSKVTINFPDGQAPSADFVRVPQGSGTVTASGSSIVVQSQGVIPANQPFEIQVPYGANVGQPANSGNSAPVQNAPVQNAPVQNAPSNGTSNDSGGGLLSGILPILCIVGLLVIFGGSSLLRGLLGGFLGSAIGGSGSNRGGGGIFGGGGGSSSGGGIFGGGGSSGSSGGRGFRQSSNQNREVPPVNNDKESGGGAGFH